MEPVYKPRELAELWRVDVSTILQLTRRANEEERLPAHKVGKSLRIPVAEAEAYWERHRVVPPPHVPAPRRRAPGYWYKDGDRVV